MLVLFVSIKDISCGYSKTCVREPPSRQTLNSGWCGKSCLSYKGTCHVILQAKLHDMYLYKITTFSHQPLRSISKVAVLHRFYCTHLKCLCKALLMSLEVLYKGTSNEYLDWLQSPVTKYFFLIILFNNPLKWNQKYHDKELIWWALDHDYRGWSLYQPL